MESQSRLHQMAIFLVYLITSAVVIMLILFILILHRPRRASAYA